MTSTSAAVKEHRDTHAHTHTANQTAHDPSDYSKNASFVYSDAYTSAVLQLLAPQQGEKILDLGCGNGELTNRLVDLVGEQDGQVWGTDSNAKMLDKAASSFPRLQGRLFQSDAQDLQLPSQRIVDFPASFDAVFTNATLHWCKDSPAGVLRGVKRALGGRKGARFVGEFGGFMNCVGVRSQLHRILREKGHDPEALDPWYFPTDVEYQELLQSEGFVVEHISLNPRFTPLSTDLHGWLQTFARGSFLATFSDAEAEEVIAEIVGRCEVDCRMASRVGQGAGTDGWAVMYVRLRFVARIL